LSIAAVVDHVGGVERPDPVVLAPDLRDVLGSVVDPRKRRGVRHPLAVVLTVVVCAVVAGARSFVAVAEWAADLPDELAQILDTDRRRPSESSRPRRSPTTPACGSLPRNSSISVASLRAGAPILRNPATELRRSRSPSRNSATSRRR
jgi:hypothetical protein